MAATKICPRCGLEKPATTEHFGRDSKRPSGLRPWCNACRKIEHAQDFQKHKTARQAKNQKWKERNPGRHNDYVKAYQARNPDKTRANNQVNNARRRGAPGSFIPEDIKRIRRRQRDRCASSWCRTKLHGLGHLDHIIPLVKGGTNDPHNLQLLCQSCNHKKHGKDPIAFAREHWLLL
jgi:5-methylcytosine-specific restriction endonuclease McrA